MGVGSTGIVGAAILTGNVTVASAVGTDAGSEGVTGGARLQARTATTRERKAV
jgi:hypothetical protein